jgi:predicted GNAT superfamily acetyltransferase
VRVARRLGMSKRVPARFASLPRANETRINAQGLLENRGLHLNLSAPRIAVEIPSDTDAMRGKNLRLALRWRMTTRIIFRRYFSRGYRVADFVPPHPQSGGLCFYVLSRS